MIPMWGLNSEERFDSVGAAGWGLPGQGALHKAMGGDEVRQQAQTPGQTP